MIFILIIVVGLIAVALHLMQEAVEKREFSLMLAGFLVSSTAAAMMAVYFLMSHYVGYMTDMTERVYISSEGYSPLEWATFSDSLTEGSMTENSIDPNETTH